MRKTSGSEAALSPYRGKVMPGTDVGGHTMERDFAATSCTVKIAHCQKFHCWSIFQKAQLSKVLKVWLWYLQRKYKTYMHE